MTSINIFLFLSSKAPWITSTSFFDLFCTAFWIIKPFNNIGADNILGTLVKSCWNGVGISNYIISEGWLSIWSAGNANNIVLLGTSTLNLVIDVDWFDTLSVGGTDSIILLNAGAFNFAIYVD